MEQFIYRSLLQQIGREQESLNLTPDWREGTLLLQKLAGKKGKVWLWEEGEGIVLPQEPPSESELTGQGDKVPCFEPSFSQKKLPLILYQDRTLKQVDSKDWEDEPLWRRTLDWLSPGGVLVLTFPRSTPDTAQRHLLIFRQLSKLRLDKYQILVSELDNSASPVSSWSVRKLEESRGCKVAYSKGHCVVFIQKLN